VKAFPQSAIILHRYPQAFIQLLAPVGTAPGTERFMLALRAPPQENLFAFKVIEDVQ